MADVPDRFHEQLEDCQLRLRVSSFDLHGYTRALRCTSDAEGLVSFGHLNVLGSDLEVPIWVRSEDLPCDHNGVHGAACGKTTNRLIRELRSIQRDLERETSRMRIEVRDDAREIRRETIKIREEVRSAVRSIR